MNPTPEEQARFDALRAKEKRRWQEYRLELAAVPTRFRDVLTASSETEASRAVASWWEQGKTFLVLAGNEGVGKSWAAVWAVAKYGGRFIRAREVAAMSDFDADAWDALLEAPLLVLDDLGTEPLDEKGWGAGRIRRLLEGRYDELGRTVVTTNLSVEKIRERYGNDGGRLFARLREAGKWVELGGESLRVAT